MSQATNISLSLNATAANTTVTVTGGSASTLTIVGIDKNRVAKYRDISLSIQDGMSASFSTEVSNRKVTSRLVTQKASNITVNGITTPKPVTADLRITSDVDHPVTTRSEIICALLQAIKFFQSDIDNGTAVV